MAPMARPDQMTSEPAMSPRDSMASATRAPEWPTTPARSLTTPRRTLTSKPMMVMRRVRAAVDRAGGAAAGMSGGYAKGDRPERIHRGGAEARRRARRLGAESAIAV